MRKLMVLVLAVLMASGGIGQAQDNKKVKLTPPDPHPSKESATEADSKTKLFPIVYQWGGTNRGTAQDYYYQGQRLRSFQQLKEVIDSLNDPAASRLLKTSADKETIGTVFIVGGSLSIVGGGYLCACS